MEKCGICAYVTHRFAVFLEAKPSEKNRQTSGYQGTYTTRFHGLTDLYYTKHAVDIYTWPDFWTNQIHRM